MHTFYIVHLFTFRPANSLSSTTINLSLFLCTVLAFFFSFLIFPIYYITSTILLPFTGPLISGQCPSLILQSLHLLHLLLNICSSFTTSISQYLFFIHYIHSLAIFPLSLIHATSACLHYRSCHSYLPCMARVHPTTLSSVLLSFSNSTLIILFSKMCIALWPFYSKKLILSWSLLSELNSCIT